MNSNINISRNKERQQEQHSFCSLCQKSGLVRKVELMPKAGVLWECIHDNIDNNSSPNGEKIRHTWTRFGSLDEMYEANERQKKTKPIFINCPQCNNRGIIKYYRKKGLAAVYYIAHYKKDRRLASRKQLKEKRCIIKPENRHIILKKLGLDIIE
jgi:hypothetical protein